MRGGSSLAGVRLFAIAATLLVSLAMRATASGKPSGSPNSGPGSSHSHRVSFRFPDGTLRDPSTDRTQMTDDPFTLAAGATSWESDLAAGSIDRLDSLSGRSASVLGVAVRHGLGGGFDAGLGVELYDFQRDELPGGGGFETSREIGAVSFGIKRCWFGVDSAGTALGTSLVVRVPGHTDGISPRTPELSLGVPWSWTDGDAWTVGAMVQGVLAENTLDSGFHGDAIASLAVSRDLATRLSSWIEIGGVASGEAGRPVLGVADGGLRWDVAPHVGVSAGASAGLGGGRSDVGGFAGISLHR